jgi:hypothetical protein
MRLAGRRVRGCPRRDDRPRDWCGRVRPNGREIVYHAGDEIAVVNADGTGVRSALPPGMSPVWSPDGRKIVFVGAGDVWVVNADGTDVRRIGRSGASPSWSPDRGLGRLREVQEPKRRHLRRASGWKQRAAVDGYEERTPATTAVARTSATSGGKPFPQQKPTALLSSRSLAVNPRSHAEAAWLRGSGVAARTGQ